MGQHITMWATNYRKKSQDRMWMCILVGLNIITDVCGYSDGRFPSACESMLPHHENRAGTPYLPQTTDSPPYMVEYIRDSNVTVTVLLKTKPDTYFRGFMLEARQTSVGNSGHRVGTFTILESDKSQLLPCGNSMAVTQKNNQRKYQLSVNWTAPVEAEFPIDVTFRATVVQSYAVFWEDITIDATIPHLISKTTPSTTTSTTQTSTTTASTMPSTTTSTTQASSTTTPTMTSSSVPALTRKAQHLQQIATALVCVDCVLTVVKLVCSAKASDLLIASSGSDCYSLHLTVVSRILIILNVVAEISSAVIFWLGEISKVVPILVLVLLIINVITLMILCLLCRLSHELKVMSVLTVHVCTAIQAILTVAVIIVAVMEIGDAGVIQKDSWLVKVTYAFSVWIFLVVILFFVFITRKKAIRCKIERSQEMEQNCKKKNVHEAKVTAAAVSVIITGTICLASAVIAGLFICQKN